MKKMRKNIDRVADRYPAISTIAGITLAAMPLWISALPTWAAWTAIIGIFFVFPMAYMLGDED